VVSLLDELTKIHIEIGSCTKCPLHLTRKNPVPGEGSKNPVIMIIGEAPGAQEDETGRPFVGRSGQLLEELLQEIGYSREDVFITSVLKSRPPNNRTPLSSEIESCVPYLHRQIEVLSPRVIVLLGSVAISTMIGPWKLGEAHGRFYEGNGRTFFMTYHPAAALRFPKYKDVMREDFRKLKHELQ
jgi:uracil-DNA glycosylase family 4